MPRFLALALALWGCTADTVDDTTDTLDPVPAVDIPLASTGLGCPDESVTLEVLATGTEVAFSSSDPSIVSVDAGGVIRPGYIGSATIRAEAVVDPEVFDEIEVAVSDAWEVFADPTADQDAADGHPDRPWRYIDLYTMHLCDGGVLHLAPGVYEQVIELVQPVTLRGPEADPPTAVIRPFASNFPGAILGALGPPPPAEVMQVGIEYVHVDGSQVEDVVFVPTSYLWFRGLLLEDGVEATVRNSRFSGFVGETAGDDNGICVHAMDSSVTIEDSVFDDCGWRAVETLAVDGVPSGVVNVRDSTFTGSDPSVSGVSATQTAVRLRAGVTGEVTGNTFSGFGPAGAAQVGWGGARVTPAGEIGYAIRAGAAGASVSGNTFESVQGLFLDDGAAGISAAALLSANTALGATMVLGPDDEAGEVRGQLASDPDQLNAVLLSVPCGQLTACEVTLSGGTWALTEDMVDPAQPVTLKSTGTAIVNIPNASVPPNVVAGTGVTVNTGQ